MLRPLPVALTLLLSAVSLFAANWTSGGPHGGVMLSLSASDSNPRVIYAGGYGGVFRSDDNGDTWRDITGGLSSVNKVAVDPGDPDTAYAIVTGGVYRTTDGGGTWTLLNTGLYRPNKIVIDPTAPKTLYVSGDCGVVFKTGSRHIGVAKSTDGGDTWQDATEGFPESGFDGCVVSIARTSSRLGGRCSMKASRSQSPPSFSCSERKVRPFRFPTRPMLEEVATAGCASFGYSTWVSRTACCTRSIRDASPFFSSERTRQGTTVGTRRTLRRLTRSMRAISQS